LDEYKGIRKLWPESVLEGDYLEDRNGKNNMNTVLKKYIARIEDNVCGISGVGNSISTTMELSHK
jgi:hypothetical protein